MKKTTAASAAGAVALASAGAVSALFLTMGASASTTPVATAEPVGDTVTETISVEYVDQNGNPVAAPTGLDEDPGFVLPRIIYEEAEIPAPIYETTLVTIPAPANAAGTYTEGGEATEGEEYDEDEHEEEDHDEYEEGEEYEEAEGAEEYEEDHEEEDEDEDEEDDH